MIILEKKKHRLQEKLNHLHKLHQPHEKEENIKNDDGIRRVVLLPETWVPFRPHKGGKSLRSIKSWSIINTKALMKRNYRTLT